MSDSEFLGRSFRVADMSDTDKPREKAINHGVKSLSDTELVAIALGSGMVGKSVLELSREILASFHNNLAELHRATISGLMSSAKGVGPAKAVQLMAAIELGMRASTAVAFKGNPVIKNGDDVHRVMRNRMRMDVEETWVLVMNRRNQIAHYLLISRGGTAATVVDPKVIFREVLARLGDAIIMVHNHPSGNLRPSGEDDNLTRRMRDGARLLDIRMIDHIIITEEGYYSYAENSRI